MNKLLDLIRGWSERITLRVIAFFPKVKPETIQTIKTAFNAKDKNLQSAIDELKSTDPANLNNYLDFEKILKWLKPLIIIAFILGFAFLSVKIYKTYKK